jgi:hypothetical protein
MHGRPTFRNCSLLPRVMPLNPAGVRPLTFPLVTNPKNCCIMNIARLLLASIVTASALVVSANAQPQKQNRPSPPATVTATIDGANVKLDYSRPSMNGRKIWGELVPFDAVWRTGANEATIITFAQPMIVGGVDVPAGAYTLWTVPKADGSAKLVINKQTGQWGTSRDGSHYDVKQDLARVDLKKTELAQPVEQFLMAIEPVASGGGVLKLSWDKLEYSVALKKK